MHPRSAPQSRLVLLLVVPAAAVWLTVLVMRGPSRAPLAAAFAVAGALALLTWLARAATPWAAATGALLTACCALQPAGWRNAFWPLLAMLVLTLGAGRVARRQRATLQSATTHEERHGRSSAQVAANLGVAALAPCLTNSWGELAALTALVAALCEAGADTVSSELGQAFGGTPRMLTTLRRVPPGTDGAVSLLGTLLGAVTAAAIALVGAWTLHLPARAGVVAGVSGLAGLVFDSLLGATLERPGGLNNDLVNFLSTLAAATLAVALAVHVF